MGDGAGGGFRRCAFVVALCLYISAARAADPAAGTEALKNPVELQTLGQLSATLERPLFSSTRRPPPKPVVRVSRPEAPPPPPPAPPPSVVLLGIVSTDGEASAAIKQGSDKVVRVRMGDDVAGWKVGRIEPRRLVLTLDERSVDFALFSGAAKSDKPAIGKAAERQVR